MQLNVAEHNFTWMRPDFFWYNTDPKAWGTQNGIDSYCGHNIWAILVCELAFEKPERCKREKKGD